MKRTALLAAIVVAVIAVACSRPTTPTHAPIVVIDRATGTIRLPLDRYVRSLRQLHLLDRASDVLVERCMENRGFSYESPARPSEELRDDRRYGIWVARSARRFGYRLPQAPRETRRYHTQSHVTRGEREALYGVGANSLTTPVRGCVGHAREQLMAETPRGLNWQLPEELGFLSLTESLKSPVVVRALTRWRKCMSKSGYQVEDPLHVRPEQLAPPGGAKDTNDVPPTEIRIAKVDVRCKRASHLVPTWATTEAAIQSRLIESHWAELVQLRAATRMLVRRAREVLATRPR